MDILIFIVVVVLAVITAPIVAGLLGWILGIFQASREGSYRRRAIKLYQRDGQAREFLILSGEPAIVEQLFKICVATSMRAEENSLAEAERNEGIAINDEKSQ